MDGPCSWGWGFVTNQDKEEHRVPFQMGTWGDGWAERGARAGEGGARPPAAATGTGAASGTEETRNGPAHSPGRLPRAPLGRTNKGTPSFWASLSPDAEL